MDAREPVADQGTEDLRPLVGQGVTRAVDHRERGTRVLPGEVHRRRVPDRGVLAARDHQRGTGVGRPRSGGHLPPRADALQRLGVDHLCRGTDEPLVAVEHLRGLDHEVASELLVAEVARPQHHLVAGHLARARQQGAHQREARHQRRLPGRHGLREVAPGGVTREKVRPPCAHLRGEREQRVEHVVGAAEPGGGRRPPHAREVGIDATQAGDPLERGLEAGLGLVVVDARTVQHEHRGARPVLDVVHLDAAGSCLHAPQPSHGSLT